MRYPLIPYNQNLKTYARELRKNMTPGEITLWQHIRKRQILGVQFQRQRPIDQYIVDFYCKAYMLAIEIDGSSHDSPEAQEKDKIRQQTLEALGVRFLRFSESQARYHPEAVVEIIKQWLSQRSPITENLSPTK
jgi:very-short-patch-repair endonuclease